MNIDPPNSIFSIGFAAQQLQAAPDQIRLIAADLGIHPETYINNIPHFAAKDIERIGRTLRLLEQQGVPFGVRRGQLR